MAAPNLYLPFKLEVDASACGARAVLLQGGEEEVDQIIQCATSLLRFKRRQLNYSTIEKETLAMLLALRHFEVYVVSSPSQVIVYTDHNPLVFLSQKYNHKKTFYVGFFCCCLGLTVLFLSEQACFLLPVIKLYFHFYIKPLFFSFVNPDCIIVTPTTPFRTKQGIIGFIRAWS